MSISLMAEERERFDDKEKMADEKQKRPPANVPTVTNASPLEVLSVGLPVRLCDAVVTKKCL
jgi:hypothetical protein